MAFLTSEQLKSMNFKSMGDHIYISDKASIYNPSKISLGSYVRIDDFAIISAGEEGIEIGNFVHIACYACMLGHSKITFHDFTGISLRSMVLSSTSDFTGDHLFNLKEFTPLNEIEGLTISINKPVVFEKVSVLGAGSIVMPGVTLASNSGVGALSMILKDTEPGGFYWGNPARLVRQATTKAFNLLEESFKNGLIKIRA
ncbi:MAG: hypothetical protein ABI266_06160 [Ginsengibacter sp.]